MQTNRTFSAGNGRLGGREDERGPRGAAERERQRLDRLGDEPVEEERPALARDLDQPRLTEDLEAVGDRRLREPQRVDLADARLLAAGETDDERGPRGVGERLEAGRKALELPRPERRGAGRAAGDGRELLH